MNQIRWQRWVCAQYGWGLWVVGGVASVFSFIAPLWVCTSNATWYFRCGPSLCMPSLSSISPLGCRFQFWGSGWVHVWVQVSLLGFSLGSGAHAVLEDSSLGASTSL